MWGSFGWPVAPPVAAPAVEPDAATCACSVAHKAAGPTFERCAWGEAHKATPDGKAHARRALRYQAASYKGDAADTARNRALRAAATKTADGLA